MTATPYKPLPCQLKFHASQARLRAITGKLASGKTRAVVEEAVNLTVANPGKAGILVGPSWRHVREALNPALLSALAARKIKFRGRYAQGLVEVGDSQIHLFAPSDAGHRPLDGLRLSWAAIDEIGYVGLATWHMLQRRSCPGARFAVSAVDPMPAWAEALFGGPEGEIIATSRERNPNPYLSSNTESSMKKSEIDSFMERRRIRHAL